MRLCVAVRLGCCVPDNAARNLEGYIRDLDMLDGVAVSRGICLSPRDLVPLCFYYVRVLAVFG